MRIGKIYEGRVTSVKDFGAFIEILPGRDGLCHISELDDKFVDKVDSVCKVGDKMQVKVIAIDDQDRVKLSRKAVLREQRGGSAAAGAASDRRRRSIVRLRAMTAKRTDFSTRYRWDASILARIARLMLAAVAHRDGTDVRTATHR